MPKVFIASDHAGFALKEALVSYVGTFGYEVEDCGAATFNTEDDYPDLIIPAAEKIAEHPDSFGIIIGASGQGEAMAANRVPGVRAAVYYGDTGHVQTDVGGTSLGMIESVRTHNNANVLSLGARFLSEEEAKAAVRTFLSTSFSGESRHIRRIEKLG